MSDDPRPNRNNDCYRFYARSEGKYKFDAGRYQEDLDAWNRRNKSRRHERPSEGGTRNSTNFRSVPQRNDPNITNHYFNGPNDGANHGHVKEHRHSDDSVTYPFVRDVEGNEYDTR